MSHLARSREAEPEQCTALTLYAPSSIDPALAYSFYKRDEERKASRDRGAAEDVQMKLQALLDMVVEANQQHSDCKEAARKEVRVGEVSLEENVGNLDSPKEGARELNRGEGDEDEVLITLGSQYHTSSEQHGAQLLVTQQPPSSSEVGWTRGVSLLPTLDQTGSLLSPPKPAEMTSRRASLESMEGIVREDGASAMSLFTSFALSETQLQAEKLKTLQLLITLINSFPVDSMYSTVEQAPSTCPAQELDIQVSSRTPKDRVLGIDARVGLDWIKPPEKRFNDSLTRATQEEMADEDFELRMTGCSRIAGQALSFTQDTTSWPRESTTEAHDIQTKPSDYESMGIEVCVTHRRDLMPKDKAGLQLSAAVEPTSGTDRVLGVQLPVRDGVRVRPPSHVPSVSEQCRAIHFTDRGRDIAEEGSNLGSPQQGTPFKGLGEASDPAIGEMVTLPKVASDSNTADRGDCSEGLPIPQVKRTSAIVKTPKKTSTVQAGQDHFLGLLALVKRK